uniref:Macrophage-capping protein-like n=1 Tax=Sinocyclocheilus rhinocerous TaxID=307959 RepID=A0A673FPF5_9TELE
MLTCFNVQKAYIFQILYIIVGLCPASLKRFVFYKVPPSQAQSALIGQLTQCIVIGRTPQALVGNVTSLSSVLPERHRIGEKSSRDEQVACAMLATQLDNFLGGDPVQHRQVQGYESPEFMNLFPRGVSYKEGGVESGFRRTQSGSGPVQRLYQIKGKRNIRAKEVGLSWQSFNKGDCFILDLGETIVSWIGSQANIFEKQKVREIAALIRDTERHGKAQITNISEGEETQEMLQVLGPVPELKESTPEEDSQADASNIASLYKVSDATGSMKLTKVSEKSPFAKDLLVRDDCFILDNGANGKIFVWKGKKIVHVYPNNLECS